MQPLGKRIWVVVALGLLAIPVGAAGVAYACTALATITASSGSAIVGTTVTVTGKGFAPHDPADIRSTPAIVHLDSATGPVLGTAAPSSNNTGGVFSVDITVPDVAPGDHILIATQNGIDGAPAYGTPARTVLTVDPAPAPVAAALPPVFVPVAAPLPLGTVPIAPSVRPKLSAAQKLTRAIAKCRSTFNVKRAKTKVGKTRVASRRAACIRRARRA